jgi:hypothetical protein
LQETKKVTKNDTYVLLVPLAVKISFRTFDPLYRTLSPTFWTKNSNYVIFVRQKVFVPWTTSNITRIEKVELKS